MNRAKKIINNISFLMFGSILAISLAFGIYQYQDKLKIQRTISNQYEKSFIEFAGFVSNVDTLLAKADVFERPEQYAPVYAELWKQAAAAQNILPSFPYNNEIVQNTIKYLSQVSDFSYSMMMKSFDGTLLSSKDKENLSQIKEIAEDLKNQLNLIITESNMNGGVVWDILANTKYSESVSGEVFAKSLAGSMIGVTKTFQDYPTLIYDGQFSDHMQNMAPKMTENKPFISEEEGAEIAGKFLSSFGVFDISCISATPEEAYGKVTPVYSYAITLNGNKKPTLYIDITKQGGQPLWMLSTEIPKYNGSHISFSEAITYAENFLAQNGYESMKYNYHSYVDDTIVVNFTPYINDVIMYPDLVKIKLNASSGEIMGFEALGYVMMHRDRQLDEPEFSIAEMLPYIPPKLTIQTINMAVIPISSYNEALCYEFNVVDVDGNHFLIYMNAITAKTEKTYKLESNEYGVLAK